MRRRRRARGARGAGRDVSRGAGRDPSRDAGSRRTARGRRPGAQVRENYADCLAALDATTPVYTPGGTEGSQTVGEVVATAPGLILVWTVGVGNTGDVLTFPDEATTAALESVGC
ncbi:MAG: hypothetical protein EHM88_20155 [Candidatus Rokuibacteriota bacterium]|nr:MAG: hypothetical protein EHM88_20155 [Candidatus Rokubacteria bacterium]